MEIKDDNVIVELDLRRITLEGFLYARATYKKGFHKLLCLTIFNDLYPYLMASARVLIILINELEGL